MGRIEIPQTACGIRLCKVTRAEQLKLAEPVMFERGVAAVDTALRRARVSGNVGPVGETGDFWADLLDENLDLVETIALDRRAWNSLKNRWARCKMETGN